MKNDRMVKRSRMITDMRSAKPANQRLQSPKARVAPKGPARLNLSRKRMPNMDIARSNKIAKHAQTENAPKVKPNLVAKKQVDIGPVKHPLIIKAEQKRAEIAKASGTPPQTSAKEIKERAIAKALTEAKVETKKDNFFKRHSKLFNIFTLSSAIVIVVGFLVYFYLPFFSVNIANAQAGINATYPEYKPDGYSLNGPVSYSNGEVTINFRANTGNTTFSIKQSKSSWDSSAVKNKVNKDSKGEFTTTEQKGLTIYTYNSNAAWVNGGILYSITGDAPLSSDQILHIATSL